MAAINLHIATEAALKTITGIDVSKAKRIVNMRKEKGILTMEDLVSATELDENHFRQLIDDGIITLEKYITEDALAKHTQKMEDNMNALIKQTQKTDEDMSALIKHTKTTDEDMKAISDKIDMLIQDRDKIRCDINELDKKFEVKVQSLKDDIQKSLDLQSQTCVQQFNTMQTNLDNMEQKLSQQFINRMNEFDGKLNQLRLEQDDRSNKLEALVKSVSTQSQKEIKELEVKIQLSADEISDIKNEVQSNNTEQQQLRLEMR